MKKLCLTLLLFAARVLPAQTPAPATPTIHADTRLVVEDLVVTDKHGHPITDLKKEDFSITEDGKPQQVRFFELRAPSPDRKPRPKIELPPNQYTNFPTQSASSALNIVLFDTLNTPTTDQMYARWQMIQFVKALPPGKPVALFTMSDKLRMIAGFNSSSEDLVAAANRVRPKISAVDEESADAQTRGSAPGGNLPSNDPTSTSIVGMSDQLNQFLFEQEAFRVGNRVEETIAVFNQLARALSAYPGRKNVIWLSEAFPISLSPDVIGPSSLGYLRSYGAVLRESSALLSTSQISVYPVDVRGVKNGNPIRLQASYDTMTQIAKETGGEAFFSTNDLKLAMEQSIERGSTYYTVAYVPENHDWNSNYRKIKIKIARPDIKADYRPGYFALPEQPKPDEDNHARIVGAMQPGAPESTMLLLRASVLPPDATRDKVSIDCGVLASDLAFSEGPDQIRQAKLEFVVVAWDKNDAAGGTQSQTMALSLKPASYQSSMQNGISAHLDLDLKPGVYTLRLGVMDDGNGKIGTLNVPLKITEKARAER